jgi:hypothetical protein
MAEQPNIQATPTSQSDETAELLERLDVAARVNTYPYNCIFIAAAAKIRELSPPAPKAAAEMAQASEHQLHDAIMNIPVDPALADEWLGGAEAYKSGHRDARHAAAELVLGSPLPVSPVAGGEEKQS